MRKIYTIQQKIGIAIIGLLCILWLLFTFIFVKTVHPDIKHRILVSSIAVSSVAFMFLLGIVYLYHKRPLLKFHSFSNKAKIGYSLLYLFFSVSFLLCIEYLLYQKDKESFSIEQEYIDKYIQDRAKNLHIELEAYQRYESVYEKLASNICTTKKYDYSKTNNKIYIFIGGDTLVLHLHRRPAMAPKTSFRHKKDGIDYYNIRSIGISIPNEPYDLSHPSSCSALNNMKQKGYIQGANLVSLIRKKAQFYNQRCVIYEEMLLNNQIISFSAFLTYNLFNSSSIAKGTNVAIRLLILLQTILTTFISGYIYKTIYRVMDRE